jgi:hypothetical protein
VRERERERERERTVFRRAEGIGHFFSALCFLGLAQYFTFNVQKIHVE